VGVPLVGDWARKYDKMGELGGEPLGKRGAFQETGVCGSTGEPEEPEEEEDTDAERRRA